MTDGIATLRTVTGWLDLLRPAAKLHELAGATRLARPELARRPAVGFDQLVALLVDAHLERPGGP